MGLFDDIPHDERFLVRAINKYAAPFVLIVLFLIVITLRLLNYFGLFSGFQGSTAIPPPSNIDQEKLERNRKKLEAESSKKESASKKTQSTPRKSKKKSA